jgi:transcriptional regulator with XRE-family HTH domain
VYLAAKNFMAGQRIDIMDLRQLIQLKRKGLSNRKVAEALGVSRNTMNTYVQAFTDHELSYEQLEGLSDGELAGLFPQADAKDAQRYEQLAGYFPTFSNELLKTGCTLQTLWRSYHPHPLPERCSWSGGYGKPNPGLPASGP